MLILAIETSCDETSVAILKDGKKLLSNIVYSQEKMHAEFGGIVPEIAARKHIETVIPTIDKALIKANVKLNKIDYIAITNGPGLITSLMIGIDTAKSLSFALKIPIIPIHHTESHIYSNFIENSKIEFPALALVVSGGHTNLILMKDHGKYEEIGSTRDDAAGEAFDKVAKLLNIGYPGGPIISQRADIGNSRAYSFPRPMIDSPDFDFSFSGLKTDVFRLVQKKKNKFTPQEINNICASFQMAVVDVLVSKTIKAAEKNSIKSVLLAGGVSANKLLRRKLKSAVSQELENTEFYYPDFQYCTDNAAMVAQAAYFHVLNKNYTTWDKVKVDPNLKLN
ncbi:MAG: tRNA (adenosine(37)-N6)-threonylcarbamoyltransferase complex transferase subunit TsaD [Parcubacteria group bacterium]|nr:tRNA (adenosine(37)-N6)-threonylcarbamoyltransferase complex transferase subunit TsaD [Parcubacteria group bacterium]